MLYWAAGLAFLLWPSRSSALERLEGVPSTFVYPVRGHLPLNVHRGTQTLLSLLLPGARFQDPFGVSCALLRSQDDPKDSLDDMRITVVGVNRGSGEIFYNAGLRRIKRFGRRGRGRGEFKDPQGVSLSPEGWIAVADTGNDRVVLLFHDGEEVRWRKAFGRRGEKEGEFDSPRDTAWDSKGNLYVADTGNNRIQFLKKGTENFRIWKPEGTVLEEPSAVEAVDAGDPWTFHREGPLADRLAVLEKKGRRIRVFTLEGKLLAEVEAQPFGANVFWRDFAFDYYGNLIVTEPSGGCLRKFDPFLQALTCFGTAGEGDYQFDDPRGICIHKQLGQVIVAEKKSVQYLWVGADLLDPRVDIRGEEWVFSFFLTERALVTVWLEDAFGRKIAEWVKKEEYDQGRQNISRRRPEGSKEKDITLVVAVMATYSSRERIEKIVRLPLKDVFPQP